MKVVGIAVAVVVLLIVGVAVYIAQNADSLIKNAIETLGSDYLGTRVSVSSVDVSLTEGTGAIRGLEIANPRGYDGPYAMRLGEIALSLNLEQLSTEQIVLKSVSIDGAQVAAVVNPQGDSNFQTLMDNLEARSGSGSTQEAAESGETTVIIDKLDFTNADARVDAALLEEPMDIDIPDVHLSGVGRKEGGVTAGEVATQLLEPITKAIVKEVARRGLGVDQVEEGVRGKINDAFSGGLDKLKGLGSDQ